MNKIHLERSSTGNCEIRPYTLLFNGIPVTLGEGIKRVFPKTDHQFALPIDKYILQYFIPEMKSIFLFPENDEKFIAEFMLDANELGCRMCYQLALERYHNSKGERFNVMKDSTIMGFSLKLLNSLERVQMVSHPNLSSEFKLRLTIYVYLKTVVFIEDLLKATKQAPSLIEKISSEELAMDSLSREFPKYLFMLIVVFLLRYLLVNI